MKRSFTYILIAAAFGIAGYFIGGFHSAKNAAIGSNAGSIVYFTAIHEKISRGEYKAASEIAEGAVDAHVSVLVQAQEHPTTMLGWIFPSVPDPISMANHTAFRRAKDYFVDKTSALQPETRKFLTESQSSTR